MSKPVADCNWFWIVSYSGRILSFFFFFLAHTYNGSESVGTDVRGKWLQLQTSNLQWVLTAVPTLKSLVLSLSFVFWYPLFIPPNSLSYARTPLGCLFFACQFCEKAWQMILEQISQCSWMEDDIFAASSDAPIHMNTRSFSQAEIDCLQLWWRFHSNSPPTLLPILCRRTDDSWS